MKKILNSAIALATLFTLSMCSNKTSSIPVESNWEVNGIYVNGNKITPPDDQKANMLFMKDFKISGDAGCNKYFGSYKADGKNLKFDGIGMTRMLCPNMNFENAFTTNLDSVSTYQITDVTLILKDNSGNNLIELNQIPVEKE